MSWQNFLKQSDFQTPPKDEEIEITVCGRGFGECIILCCGNKDFIVIDSFINRETGNPIAIDYLKVLDLDCTHIKRFVLTHWHQDHITGASTLIEQLDENAKIVLSPIMSEKKFLEYMEIGIAEQNKSVSEFAKVLQYLKDTKFKHAIAAGQNKITYKIAEKANVYSLSPSDEDLFSYIDSLVIPSEDRATSYSFPDDNLLSIVLLLEHGTGGFLLGSDLENFNDDKRGWKNVVKNYESTNVKPFLFKIPHHGSQNGYNEDVWKQILAKFPISIITVYNKGLKLPKDEEIERIKKLSKAVYVVGNKDTKKGKDIIKSVKNSMPNVNISMISTELGIVRYRKNTKTGEEKIETFGCVKKYENENSGI